MTVSTDRSARTTPAEHDHDGWTAQRIAALAVVGVGGLLVSLTQSLLVPVLPTIEADLGSSATATQWLLTSTLLVAAVAVPVVGRLADLYGKKRMLLVSSVALTVGSLVSALSTSLAPMLVGRAIVGVSTVAIPVGISLIGTVLPRHLASSGIALVSATLGIGGALGLPLAGLVAEHSDYHVLFWICVVGGALAFAGTLVSLPETDRAEHGRMDYPGSLLLAAALVSLLLPLSQGGSWGWGSARTLALFAAAAVLFVAFVSLELWRRSPLVDVRSAAKAPILLTNIASICVGFALFASLIGTASYVQAPEASGYGFGSSILVAGLCLLPSGLAMLLLSPVSARISDRFGPKITLALGAAIVAAGFVVRMVCTGALWEVIVGTSIAGAGTGIAYAAMPGLINLATPRAALAAANSLNALCRSLGSSLASAVGGTILAAQVITLGPATLPSLTGYRILFALCAGAALLGAVIALLVPRVPHRD
ncbi:Sugar transporter [Jatrophihabitans endophyticus]|uniref:Sugar transporter n=1 Tax=Jatrophihabitans endophyticus TaxID=1206085 RepID=A0A1M5K5U5_9ACTN|nr:MFS transporter [Jatrophihabitans endophyticus]SHG47849.1 Sugar transporter [Jatrophihabitans endophyticus]